MNKFVGDGLEALAVIKWLGAQRPDDDSAASKSLKCQTGPNAGKPGVCPEDHADAPTADKPINAPQPPPVVASHHQAVAAIGRIAGMTWDGLKAAGAAAAHVEHIASAWMADNVGATVAKLPGPLQRAVKGVYVVGKLGTSAAFATYTAGQAMAESVARERGASPEQAATLRKVLASVDVALAKPVVLACEFSGLGAFTIPAGLIPVGSMGYLAYSTAKDPAATGRAALKAVRAAAKRLGLSKAHDASDALQRLMDGVLTAPDQDWYMALVLHALDEVQDLGLAVEVADAATAEGSPTERREKRREERRKAVLAMLDGWEPPAPPAAPDPSAVALADAAARLTDAAREMRQRPTATRKTILRDGEGNITAIEEGPSTITE